MLERIKTESLGLFCPELADVFVRREAFEGLQPPAEILCIDEVIEVPLELRVAAVMVALDRGFLDRPVHPLDLSVGPRVIDLGEAMFDAVNAGWIDLGVAGTEHVASTTLLRNVFAAAQKAAAGTA